jgi:hypothetical protein
MDSLVEYCFLIHDASQESWEWVVLSDGIFRDVSLPTREDVEFLVDLMRQNGWALISVTLLPPIPTDVPVSETWLFERRQSNSAAQTPKG